MGLARDSFAAGREQREPLKEAESKQQQGMEEENEEAFHWVVELQQLQAAS